MLKNNVSNEQGKKVIEFSSSDFEPMNFSSGLERYYGEKEVYENLKSSGIAMKVDGEVFSGINLKDYLEEQKHFDDFPKKRFDYGPLNYDRAVKSLVDNIGNDNYEVSGNFSRESIINDINKDINGEEKLVVPYVSEILAGEMVKNNFVPKKDEVINREFIRYCYVSGFENKNKNANITATDQRLSANKIFNGISEINLTDMMDKAVTELKKKPEYKNLTDKNISDVLTKYADKLSDFITGEVSDVLQSRNRINPSFTYAMKDVARSVANNSLNKINNGNNERKNFHI
jgi:hypothetical protein